MIKPEQYLTAWPKYARGKDVKQRAVLIFAFIRCYLDYFRWPSHLSQRLLYNVMPSEDQ